MAKPAKASEEPLDEVDLRRLLRVAAAEDTAILVGGQALAFWLLYFGLFKSDERPSITRDVDFFVPNAGRTDFVEALAQAIQGVSEIPHEKALTALVGQAIRFTSETSYIHADVIFRVVGVGAEELQDRAMTVEVSGAGAMRVMDPITVLKSRVENLHALADKQDAQGIQQCRLAIRATGRYLEEVRKSLDTSLAQGKRDPMLGLVQRIADIAESAAGRTAAKQYGVHPADALVPHLVRNAPFHRKRLPQLAGLMSAPRREELGLGNPQAGFVRPGR